MPIRFRCPCEQKLKAGDDAAGKRAKCPKCGKWLRVPQSGSYEPVAEEVESAKLAEKGPQVQEPVSPEAAGEAVSHPRGKGRIVVADSTPLDLATMAGIIRDHGYDVLEAADGAKAVELIRKELPDAAILDVRLDMLSGFKVAEQIRNPGDVRNKRIWNIPVIMTTVRLSGRDKQYAMSLGVKGFFRKPVPPASLCSRLEKELSRHRRR